VLESKEWARDNRIFSRGVDVLAPGFKISAAYRRNFGVFFVFGPHRLLVYRCFPVFFVLNFKNLKKFINNHQKNWEKI